MKSKVDSDQVIAMLGIGFTRPQIAKRLGVSEKTVTRTVKSRGTHIDQIAAQSYLIDTKDEYLLWKLAFNAYCSVTQISWLFGVSRQAVYEILQMTPRLCSGWKGKKNDRRN